MKLEIWEIKIVNGNAIIVNKIPFHCPQCKVELIYHDFLVGRSPQGFYYCDIHFKCPVCGYHETHGVVIGEKEYELLRKSKYHGKVLTKELIELNLIPWDMINTIRERLKRWGYW